MQEPKDKEQFGDKDLEEIVGNLLRIGVLTAALIVIVGAVLYLANYGTAAPAYSTFKGEPQNLRDIFSILGNITALNGRDLIQLGILLLIATPIARVVFSVFAFARERDRTYVMVTLIVMVILIYSLIWGRI